MYNLRTIEKIQDILTVLLYASFVILVSDSRGVYVMLGLVVLIALLGMLNGNFKLKIDILAKYMLAFGVFSLSSSLWATSPAYAIEKGTTILELMVVFVVLYSCYYQAPVDRLLKVLMWAGFLLSIYTIAFIGVDALTETLEEEGRIESSFANVNTIGMLACTSILICLYYTIHVKRNTVTLLLCIPALYIVAGSGSRKAFTMLILGVIALFYFKQKYDSKGSRRLLTILAALFVLVVIGYILSETGLFGGTLYRMSRLFDAFTGGDNADDSSLIRAYFRQVGFSQLLETPLLGIGMGNARLLVHNIGKDCYLHCNYAELAANGGIAGLILYYWIYVRLLKKGYANLTSNRQVVIILVLLLLQLVMDYGMVSYYSKQTYFMLMIFLLCLERKETYYA